MLRRLTSIILVLTLICSLSGCAQVCKNPGDTTSKLQATADDLKNMSLVLNGALAGGFDFQIELAYTVTVAALAQAEKLLKQWCPSLEEIKALEANVATDVKPQAQRAIARAKTLKLIK